MGLQLIDNVIQPPGRHAESRRWGAGEGALPSWLTFGSADTSDTGSTSAFTSMAAGVPGLTITSAVQSGTTQAARRRASLIGPTVDLSKAAGWRLRVVVTGGTSSNRLAAMGFADTHVGGNTQGCAIQQAGSAPDSFATLFPTVSASQKNTRLRWLAPPARHDLVLWGTADKMVYLGAGDQLDWGHQFPTADLVYGAACKPYITFRTSADAVQTSAIIHRFDLDVFYD